MGANITADEVYSTVYVHSGDKVPNSLIQVTKSMVLKYLGLYLERCER